MEFIERALLGFSSHPIEGLDLLLHRVFDLLRHLERAGLQFRAKCSGHVYLADSFAELVVQQLNATLPARPDLLGPLQKLAIEIEVRHHERGRQVRRVLPNDLPAKVSLPVPERLRLQQRLQRLKELRLRNVERLQAGNPRCREIGTPVEGRRQRLQFGAVHLVEDFIRIAEFDAAQRGLGHRGFDPHHRLRLLGGLGWRVAQQFEHLLNLGQVALAGLFHSPIALQIIIAIGQPEPAGAGKCNHLRRIRQILRGAEAEHHAAIAKGYQVLPGNPGRKAAHIFDASQLPQPGFKRRGPGFFNGRFVHARGEKIPDLLLNRVTARRRTRRVFENSPKKALVLVGQLAVDAPRRLVGRNRIFLPPPAA